MMLQQLIDKLKRERTTPEGCHDCARNECQVECEWCEGFNTRSNTLIAELEQMLAEAAEKERVDA